MNFAIIVNGVIDNIIVGPLPAGMEGVPTDGTDAAIGDAYVDGVFVKPEAAPEAQTNVDPLAEYVASMSAEAYDRLPAGMRELLSQYR